MNINWANVFNWLPLLKCFVVGGLICVIGQILIDKTKLTPARIFLFGLYIFLYFFAMFFLCINFLKSVKILSKEF